MAEKSGFYDATEESPDYDSAAQSEFVDMLSIGIPPGYKNELQATVDTGLQVKVDSGGIISKGRFYIQDEDADGSSPKTLAIDAATAGYLRKDRIVVEFDINNTTAQLKVSKGTESAASPTAPNLVETSTKWEEPIAIVNVNGGAIDSIDDERNIVGARVDISVIANKADLAGAVFTGDIQAPKVHIGSANDYLYIDANGNLMFKKDGCIEAQVVLGVVGTSETAPAGTYPENTIYLEREA